MATNDDDEEPKPPTAREFLASFYGRTVSAVTDTDELFRLRTFVLILVMVVCLVTAPVPFNYVGTIAGVMLAFSAPTRRRQR